MSDIEFMKTALALAKKGRGFVSPNPMVGAVVVKNNIIIGQGWHEAYGGPHAEVNAIDDAGPNAEGADIYVTLEPCNHTGKTPPCTKKIMDAGIKHVFMAMRDPNPSVCGGGMAFLQKNGIGVTCGICEQEAVKLNEFFIKHSRVKKPFVTIKCASTLDGRLATKTGNSKWITGPASREYVHQLRHNYDAILVGSDTVRHDNPSLTTRLGNDNEKKAFRDPTRIVLDSRLSISEDSKIFNLDSESPTLIVTGENPPAQKKSTLEEKGATIIEIPLKKGLIDLDRLMDVLGGMKISSILIEGGSRVIASAFSEKIVDKALFFYAPKILGGDDGVPVCRGEGPELMADSINLEKIMVRRFDDDILIEGYVKEKPAV